MNTKSSCSVMRIGYKRDSEEVYYPRTPSLPIVRTAPNAHPTAKARHTLARQAETLQHQLMIAWQRNEKEKKRKRNKMLHTLEFFVLYLPWGYKRSPTRLTPSAWWLSAPANKEKHRRRPLTKTGIHHKARRPNTKEDFSTSPLFTVLREWDSHYLTKTTRRRRTNNQANAKTRSSSARGCHSLAPCALAADQTAPDATSRSDKTQRRGEAGAAGEREGWRKRVSPCAAVRGTLGLLRHQIGKCGPGTGGKAL